MDDVRLKVITEDLLGELDRMMAIFEETKLSNKRGDFFSEVKPFADEMKRKKEEWAELSFQWIKEVRPKHLHEKQIESAGEQIEMLSVQAFYPDTSRTRFINYLQSVRYILKGLKDQLDK